MRHRGIAAVLSAVALLSGCAPAGSAAGPDTRHSAPARPGASPATAGTARTVPGALPVRALSALPPEAAATWRLIRDGGPFPYPRDGVVFQNRERLLPVKARGHYREYTVPTPRRSDRGARRMVSGGGAGEIYYTADHYRSFVAVDVRR
ncbi:ribonuclease domain-containing protein [Streptosporangium sp. NPDC003464]